MLGRRRGGHGGATLDTSAGTAPRVLLIHNYPTPYRLPLFEALAETVQLEIWFCRSQEQGRRWLGTPVLRRAKYSCLRGSLVGPFVVNWTLPLRLRHLHVDTVVVAEDLSTVLSSVLICLYCRAKHVPLVLWSEHVRYPSGGRRYDVGALKHTAYKTLRRWLLERADVVVAMSGAASVRQLRDLGRTERVWSGPQVLPAGYLPRPSGAPRSEKVRLLFVGYLRPEKNVVELIRTFRSLAFRDAELVIVGDGPERHRVDEAAAGAPNVRVLGHVDGSEKSQELERASALILPSTYEPWGLVVNEALSLGTPVLVSSQAGAAELVRDGENGLKFDTAPRSTAIVDILLRFIDDPGLRSRLQAGARADDLERLSSLDVGLAHLREGLGDALGRDVRPTSDGRNRWQ